MILEELVATGAVNDFLRMIIYPPLYNLSLKEFYTFFSFFPFFPLIDLCTHKPFPRSSPLLPTKETKAKTKQNQKQPKISPSPLYSYPRTSCAFFPQLPISTPTSHFISHPFPTLEDLKSQPPTFSPVQKNFSPAGHGYTRIVLVVGEH